MTALFATDMPVERRSLDLLLGPRKVVPQRRLVERDTVRLADRCGRFESAKCV